MRLRDRFDSRRVFLDLDEKGHSDIDVTLFIVTILYYSKKIIVLSSA